MRQVSQPIEQSIMLLKGAHSIRKQEKFDMPIPKGRRKKAVLHLHLPAADCDTMNLPSITMERVFNLSIFRLCGSWIRDSYSMFSLKRPKLQLQF